jgi:hypothetical protein
MNPLFVVILAASLPTFRDFSRIDRERRTTNDRSVPDPGVTASHAKIYEVDPLVCPKCQGAMRVISSIEDPSVIRAILDHRSSGS